MKIRVELENNGYDIILERGCLGRAGELLDLDRRVLIVTDDGVPCEYAERVAEQCRRPVIVTVKSGEGSKSFATFEELCRELLSEGFTRTDCVVAVGGGVVGDLAGFVAASYMRGIDFYNIPTTVLSQVDSSIGGKVAINLDSIKNIIGAFYQPRRVLIDPEVLATLPRRQIANGLAEAVKMSLTSDRELFELFESGNIEENMETVIARSLMIKKSVVEQDEREGGLRRILNFGHTVGHGIESEEGLSRLYHGECVALGMLPMCGEAVRARLLPVLRRLGLPTELDCDPERVISAMGHDKKLAGDSITVTYVNEVGKFELVSLPIDEFSRKVREVLR